MQRGTANRLPPLASLYPDVLGFVSGGTRLTVDCVQAALGVYPKRVAVGQPFEMLVLLQNLCDHPITPKVVFQLPRRNPMGERLSLFTPRDSIDVTMAAGEVGLLHVPVRPQLPTPVGQNYPVVVRIEAVRPRGAKLIRDPNGGRAPGAFAMSPHRLAILQREVGFAASLAALSPVTNTMRGSFDILPGQILQATADVSSRYEILWDSKQLVQDQTAYASIEVETRELVRKFTRAALYEALQSETKRRYELAGLSIMLGEIIAISKLLTYIMEDGLEIEPGFSLPASNWFQRLTLFRNNADLLADMDRLIAALYSALIIDAGQLGFTLLSQRLGQPNAHDAVTNRTNRATKPLQNPLGLPEEQVAHIAEIDDALNRVVSMDLTHVYWPLALAGVLQHLLIRGPKENLWKTLEEMRIAWRSRNMTGLPHADVMSSLMTDGLQSAEQSLSRLRVLLELTGSAKAVITDGIAFYQTLKDKSDEELIAGDLPRDEVERGLQDLLAM